MQLSVVELSIGGIIRRWNFPWMEFPGWNFRGWIFRYISKTTLNLFQDIADTSPSCFLCSQQTNEEKEMKGLTPWARYGTVHTVHTVRATQSHSAAIPYKFSGLGYWSASCADTYNTPCDSLRCSRWDCKAHSDNSHSSAAITVIIFLLLLRHNHVLLLSSF